MSIYAFSIILLKILLFNVFFAIVRDSKIGTPALFSDDKVLENISETSFDYKVLLKSSQ